MHLDSGGVHLEYVGQGKVLWNEIGHRASRCIIITVESLISSGMLVFMDIVLLKT